MKKILFDIGHPAHVHYFRNLIEILKSRDNQVFLLARDKEVTHHLLDAYNIPYQSKGKGGTGIIDRGIYTVKSLAAIHTSIRKFKPDLCISHASPYLSVVSAMHKVPHLLINDTEGAFLFSKMVSLFKPHLLLPDSFEKEIRSEHHKVPAYLELAYLHPELYEPNSNILQKTGRDYLLVRFVSGSATHDLGSKAIDNEFKIRLVKALAAYKKVWISSEITLPPELEKYRLSVPPQNIHDVIAHASLLVGGSATMSCEAAMLGVPSVLINKNRWGYIRELEERYGLVHHFKNTPEGQTQAIEKAISILKEDEDQNGNKTRNNPNKWKAKQTEILKEKKNMTSILLEQIDKILDEKFA